MRELKLGLLALVVAGIALVSAVAAAADERFRLSNGLQVILQPDVSRPRVAASVSYRVGQRDDPDGFGGLAHFVEHLMFEGSLNVEPGEHFELLERAGATRIQGTTGLDRTTLSSEVPKHEWRLPLWLESERMAFLLSRIDEAAVEKQRNIILHEAYERGLHLAWGSRWTEASRSLFPEGHPYHWDRGSAVADIELEDARVFFQQYFGPNRATLALVGAFDPKQARTTIERYFSGIKNSFDAHAPVSAPYAPLSEAASISRHASVLRESVVVAWPVPAQFSEAAPRFAVLAEYLRGQQRLSSSLGEAAVAELNVAFDPHELASVFWIEAAMLEDGRTDEVHAMIARELTRLAGEGVDPAGFALATRRVVSCWSSLSDDFSARADFLSKYGRSVESEAVRHSRVSLDAVMRLVSWLSTARPLVMTTRFDPRVRWGAYTE